MATPKLLFDHNCPICVNYARMIRNKISGTQLEFGQSEPGADDFTYITALGDEVKGRAGVERLAKDFPSVLSYFWMLPKKYREKAIQAAYNIGSTARNTLRRKSGCGCGK